MTVEPPALGGILVHGMDGRPAPGDWPPLVENEVRRVLARFGLPASPDGEATVVTWHSPRPFSAAAIVGHHESRLFVKRHHCLVRTPSELMAEHRFMSFLRQRGVPVPEVVVAPEGVSAVALGEWTYEVHRPSKGEDLYREVMSWRPFRQRGHAWSAGAALARLHLAAEGFDAPPRPPGVLVACWVSGEPDLMDALGGLVAARPALAGALSRRPWRQDVARLLPPLHRPLAEVAGDLRPLWTHNDWHASNLFWCGQPSPSGQPSPAATGSQGATVCGVIDFGLCNQTTAVYDLATAIERHAIGWLDQVAGGHPVHLDQMEALVEGYLAVRPLDPAEVEALPALLPLVHLEQALSELEYFEAVVASAANAELAYRSFFLGHAAWFGTAGGRALLEDLRRVLVSGQGDGDRSPRKGQEGERCGKERDWWGARAVRARPAHRLLP
jgi:Ser/Thr protein kinase RdoA (MazF antagonist)